MAHPSVITSLEAENDLVEMFDLIANEHGVDRAELVLRRIEATIASLAEWPRIGRIREDIDGSPRTFSIWPWLLVYEPQQSGIGIILWRVLAGRRDLPTVVHPPVR